MITSRVCMFVYIIKRTWKSVRYFNETWRIWLRFQRHTSGKARTCNSWRWVTRRISYAKFSSRSESNTFTFFFIKLNSVSLLLAANSETLSERVHVRACVGDIACVCFSVILQQSLLAVIFQITSPQPGHSTPWKDPPRASYAVKLSSRLYFIFCVVL